MPNKQAHERKQARERFSRARRIEQEFSSQLASVGRHIGTIIKGFAPEGVVKNQRELDAALNEYSKILSPWATSVTSRMQAQVNQRDMAAWQQLARTMGRSLRRDLFNAPVNIPLQEAMAEQVHLITSLPLRAAERVHDLSIRALLESSRTEEVSKEIMRSGKVAASKAKALARDAISRTSSLLTQVRAEHIGSEGYIWRTSMDADVRPLHRKLEGKFIKWNSPPVSGENGERAHAGQIYGCRCWEEPVIPDIIQDHRYIN